MPQRWNAVTFLEGGGRGGEIGSKFSPQRHRDELSENMSLEFLNGT